MKKPLFFLVFVSFLLAFVGCEKPVTENFSATYAVHTINYEPCDEYGIYLLADGTASQLGKSVWESCTTVYMEDEKIANECNQNMGFPQDGTMTFTADDGSQLFGTFEGIFDGVTGCGKYIITSGNGRFQDATGEGVYEWVDNPNGPNPLTWDGTITYYD